MKILNRLIGEKKVSPPSWIASNMLYAHIHGSTMYGYNTNSSDWDIYGVFMPPKHILFPHTEGWINGFNNPPSFDVWIQHHVKHEDKEYDFQIFNVAKYLRMLQVGNPNTVECLYAPHECILHKTASFQPVIDNRELFLSQNCITQYRGYLVSQMHKMVSREATGNRKELIDKHGFDVKYGSHGVRLALYCEQILEYGTLELRKDSKLLKAIRGGEFSLAEVRSMIHNALERIDRLKSTTKLPVKPDPQKVYDLLLSIIESHYGKISTFKMEDSEAERKLRQIKDILQ